MEEELPFKKRESIFFGLFALFILAAAMFLLIFSLEKINIVTVEQQVVIEEKTLDSESKNL